MTTLSTTEKDTIHSISLSGEIWKQAKGYSSNYYASNMGRLLTTRHHGGYRIAILKPGSDPSGHLRTVMNRKTVKVHRVIAQTWIPNPMSLPIVNHLNCDPSDNRVENLEWATHQRNSKHAYENGRLSKSLEAARKALPRTFTNEELFLIWDMTYQKTNTEIRAVYDELQKIFPNVKRQTLRSVKNCASDYTAYKYWLQSRITQ